MFFKFVTSFIVIASLFVAGCNNGKKKDAGAELPDDTTAQVYYESANEKLRAGNYNQAIPLYQSLEARYPYGKYAEQAQLEIAYAYYKARELPLAIGAAERFVRLHPTHPSVDYAYYLKGLASFDEDTSFLGRFTGADDLTERDARGAQDAFDAFRELTSKFPDSQYAEDSLQRMKYLFGVLANHEISIADYYLRRGAYVAVVNRAKHVVENYQRTPAVEDALGLMAQAYDAMGMADLRDDTLRVLETNFPGSRYLTLSES